MNYFTELIESYLRLHEAKVELDPQALQLATGYYNQANANTAPDKDNSPILIAVKEIGGNVYKNKDNKVIYDNFPGLMASKAINPGGQGSLRQNFNDFVKMFSSESVGKVTQGTQGNQPSNGGALGSPQPVTKKDIYKQLGFNADKIFDKLGVASFDSWISGKSKASLNTNLMMKILRTAFPATDDSEEAKRSRDNEIKLQILQKKGTAYQIIRSLKRRFGGTDEDGSLARTLFNHVMIVESADGKQKILKTNNEELISSTYSNLERMIGRISNLIKNKETVTPEECNKFQDTIIPIHGSRIYFNDRGTNTGIVVDDELGAIRNVFDNLLKSAGCGIGSTRVMGSIIGAAPQIRGSFSESVHSLVVEAANCSKLDPGPEQTRCADRLGELFEDFRNKEDLLIQSLLEYNTVLKKGEGSIPIGEENSGESLAYSYLFDKYGDKVGSVILRSLVYLARKSYIDRQPDTVIPIQKDTRFGKKGDTLELWNDKERFLRAMAQYGISRESAEEHMIVKDGKFGADVSLKTYVTLKDGISLGSASENTLTTLISGKLCGDKCTDEEREEYRLLRDGMAKALNQPWMRNLASDRYVSVASLEDEINKAENQIDLLSENTLVTGKDGKELNINTLENFVETLNKQIKSEFSFSDMQESGLLDKLDKYIKEDKNPNQLKSMMKNFIRAQMLENYSKSNDSKEVQAYKDHLLMSEFLAGGSRNPNTLITANGVEGQDTFTGKQNDLLYAVIKFNSGEPGYSVRTNKDGSETTYLGPGPNGNTVVLYRASTTTSSSGRRSRSSHVEYNTVKNLRLKNPLS